MWEVGSASSFCVAPQQRHLLLGPSTTSVINQSEPHEGGSSGRFIFEPGSPPPSDIAHVTILGFNHYWTREVGRPEQLSNFTLPFGQVVAGLKFCEDGTSVTVVPSNDGVIRLYQINSQARAMRRSAVSNVGHRSQDRQSSGPIRQGSWHVYALRRGWTSGVIKAINYSGDGRWVGICTRKRTVHIFIINPHGGKSDEATFHYLEWAS